MEGKQGSINGTRENGRPGVGAPEHSKAAAATVAWSLYRHKVAKSQRARESPLQRAGRSRGGWIWKGTHGFDVLIDFLKICIWYIHAQLITRKRHLSSIESRVSDHLLGGTVLQVMRSPHSSLRREVTTLHVSFLPSSPPSCPLLSPPLSLFPSPSHSPSLSSLSSLPLSSRSISVLCNHIIVNKAPCAVFFI